MENAKKHYWGIVQKDMTVFEGSFNQCWNKLVEKYSVNTLAELAAAGISISRIN